MPRLQKVLRWLPGLLGGLRKFELAWCDAVGPHLGWAMDVALELEWLELRSVAKECTRHVV